MQAEARFRAMGSDCHVVLVGAADGTLDDVRSEVDRLERLWSRFIPASEVELLNNAGGRPLAVSAETFELVRLALEASEATSGLFDPTVLRALVAAGYDRSFEQLDPPAESQAPEPSPGCSGITLDPDAMTITLPPGVWFDPGGIGKGYAVDRVSQMLLESKKARGACINMGGDLRVWGEPPSPEAWTIAVENPSGSEPLAVIALQDGAVATSSRARRRWALAGQTMHHIIDPRTGAPAASDLTAVTVVAGEAWWAEILAKVALISGVEDAIRFLTDADAPALLIDTFGKPHGVCGMDAWLS